MLLGDLLSAAGGCDTFNHNTCENHLKEVQGAATTPLFTPPLFQDTWPCIQVLCASETCPLTKLNLQRLQRNYRAMIRQICNVRLRDIVTTRSNELLARLGIHTCHKLWAKICEIRQNFNGDLTKFYEIFFNITLGLPQYSLKSFLSCKKLVEATSVNELCLFLDKTCCKMV